MSKRRLNGGFGEGRIREVEPKARLDHLVPVPPDVLNSFTELVTTEDNCYWDHYRCPQCQEGVAFDTTSFNRHTGTDFSNLDLEVRGEFERARQPGRGEYFLDFHCPGCHAPVRIVYACFFVGKGSLHYVVRTILESARGERPHPSWPPDAGSSA